MKKVLLFFILLFVPLIINASEKEINIYLFYGNGCPHCESEIKYLNKYIEDKQNIKLYKYEIWYNKENSNKFKEAQKLLDDKSNGVPYLVIGDDVIVGYNESSTFKRIENLINYYLENEYVDVLKEEFNKINKENENNIFDIPLLGEVNARDVSLPILAMIIGSIDGFNPCAMWVLIFLITMLFGMKDRKKMWILGLAFLITSALTYTLFMLSWLSLAMFMGSILIIRIIIGLIAIIFGILNIKNFINTKDNNTCKAVNVKRKKRIVEFIKKITTEKKFILSLLGIIVLAVLINIIELICSLGLPVVFTQILSLNKLNSFKYGFNIFVYIFFFLLDDVIIFYIAMKTLKVTNIKTKYTKYSHLIGGIIMILVGILMIFKMNWLMFNF